MNPLGLRLGDFLDAVASDGPAPSAGGAAAITVAMAAGLAAMAARLSDGDAAGRWVARAEAVRADVTPLAQADAEAYARVLEAARRDRDDPGRADALREALSAASEVPFRVAGYAAEVCVLATEVAEGGNPRVRGEAAAAGLLAHAAAEVAATLISLNLRGREDARPGEARRLAAAAGARSAALKEA